MAALPGHQRADAGGDHGAQAVGADHGVGVHDHRASVVVREHRAHDASLHPADEVGHAHVVSHRRAGRDRRVDEEAVEDRAPRGEERRHAVLRLDGDVDNLVLVLEHGPAHRRRPLRLDAAEEPPARELEDPGPHEGVRRQRVAPVRAAVHGEDAEPPPRQEHRGGGARGARPDHDDVGGPGARRVRS